MTRPLMMAIAKDSLLGAESNEQLFEGDKLTSAACGCDCSCPCSFWVCS